MIPCCSWSYRSIVSEHRQRQHRRISGLFHLSHAWNKSRKSVRVGGLVVPENHQPRSQGPLWPSTMVGDPGNEVGRERTLEARLGNRCRRETIAWRNNMAVFNFSRAWTLLEFWLCLGALISNTAMAKKPVRRRYAWWCGKWRRICADMSFCFRDVM